MSETHSRRQFIRGAGVVGATVAGIGAGSAPTAAQNETEDGGSCDPEESLECSYGGEPDYGVSYLVGRVKEHFSGLGGQDEYEDKQAETIVTQAKYDAQTIQSSNKSVLTTLENLIANAKSVAYQKGRAAYLEALNAGKAPAEALTKAKKAITEYIAPNQKNLVERWNQVGIQLELIQQKGRDLDLGNIIRGYEHGGGFNGSHRGVTIKKGTVTFVDGETADEYWYALDSVNHVAAFGSYLPGSDYENHGSYIGITDQNNNYQIKGFSEFKRFGSIFSELQRIHDEAHSEITQFSQGIADSYNAGEISTEDITTPQDLWQMSSEDAENPYAAADLAGLGLEVNQASSVTVDLLDDGVLLDGSVYLSESPIGESLSVGTVYDPTQSVETDLDGNPIDYEGTVDDPVPLDGLTYIAYNKTDGGSTYSKLEQPFEVVDAVGEDGETLDAVGYEPAGGQQTTTTDIDELKKELQAMNDEITRLEKERQEIAGGGGLFGGIGGNVSGQTVVGAIVVLLALAGLSGGGS